MTEQASRQDEIAIQGATLLPTRRQQLEYLGEVCLGDAVRLERLTSLLSDQPRIQGLLTSVGDTVATDTQVVEPARRSIGKFQILKAIGNGGMGAVFLAENTQENRQVALKVPRAEFLADPHHRRRFVNESKLSIKLRHPGLVSVLEVGTEGAVTFIASEYCQLGDLARWLENSKELASARTIALFVAEICDAVVYIHEQGILHLDLKPSNILLQRRESNHPEPGRLSLEFLSPLVSDFGVAKPFDIEATKTNTSLVIGTLLYMSPEQLAPHLGKVSHRSDQYSVGIILAQLLGLRISREGLNYREIQATLEGDGFSNGCAIAAESLPRDLRLILQKCTASYPENRYSSAKALAEDLRAFAAGSTVAAKRPSPWASVNSWIRRKPRIKEAWWICVGCNSVMLAWMIAGIALIPRTDFPGSNRVYALSASISLVFLNTIPMGLFSLLGLRGFRWPVLPALTLVVFAVVLVPILVLSGLLDAVPGMYENSPFFERLNHFLVLSFGLTQFVALSIAYIATKQLKKT